MGVAAVQVAVAPDVEHGVAATGVARDEVPAVPKHARWRRGCDVALRFHPPRAIDGLAAAHPQHFLRHAPRRQIRTTEDDRGERQGIAHIATGSSRDRPQHAAIVVANQGKQTAVVGNRAREFGQSRHRIGEAWDGRRVSCARVAVSSASR